MRCDLIYRLKFSRIVITTVIKIFLFFVPFIYFSRIFLILYLLFSFSFILFVLFLNMNFFLFFQLSILVSILLLL